MKNDKVKMLVFHPVIAPYRIDFFNELYSQLGAEVCLFYRNLSSQKFDYEKIEKWRRVWMYGLQKLLDS